MQLTHAGRKASTSVPWLGGHELSHDDGGWQPVAPSAIPFSPHYPIPAALTIEQILALQQKFVTTAGRALNAGFKVIELHAAHAVICSTAFSRRSVTSAPTITAAASTTAFGC